MSFLSLAGGAAGAFLPKASTRSARLVDRAGAWNAVAQAARRSTRRLRAMAATDVSRLRGAKDLRPSKMVG